MLRFVGNDLRLVLAEAKANRCRVILVKDHGVYIMSEIGVSNEQGQRTLLAYTVGCNPDKDDFDQWWELARSEFGGDDFGEYLDINDPLLSGLLESSNDLVVRATNTHLYLEAVKPLLDTN